MDGPTGGGVGLGAGRWTSPERLRRLWVPRIVRPSLPSAVAGAEPSWRRPRGRATRPKIPLKGSSRPSRRPFAVAGAEGLFSVGPGETTRGPVVAWPDPRLWDGNEGSQSLGGTVVPRIVVPGPLETRDLDKKEKTFRGAKFRRTVCPGFPRAGVPTRVLSACPGN